MSSKHLLNEIIEWDVQNWSVALQYWKQNTNMLLSSANALEIGCKNGGLSLWAAMNGIQILCTDLNGPTNEAIEKHKRWNTSHLIKYDALNVLDLPHLGKFDIALFKSVLGSLGNASMQKRAITKIHTALKRNGELWFAENLIASQAHQFLRKKYTNWGRTWKYVSIQEMDEYLSIFSEVQYITVGFLGTLGRVEKQRGFLGKLDRLFMDRLVPSDWRYIIIGVAKK
jgi:2-polyprenyl-3-methyl-5-hydroxy-6-metoxy-1,4-benzoquinol methylase